MLPDRDEEESGRGGDSDEHSEMDDDNELTLFFISFGVLLAFSS